MINALEHTTVEKTGMSRPDIPRKLYALMEDRKTGKQEPSGFAIREEHQLKLSLYATFWANSAEYGHARAQAHRLLGSHLYSEVLHRLNEIQSAVADQDDSAAHALINSLKKDLIDAFV